MDKFEFETAASTMFGNLTAENQNSYYPQIISMISIKIYEEVYPILVTLN